MKRNDINLNGIPKIVSLGIRKVRNIGILEYLGIIRNI
jgi:hypothetical protein